MQLTHFGSDTGSESDQDDCASTCTSWAPANSYDAWCCELYEDSGTGINWVCRVYDTYAMHSVSVPYPKFAGLGRCEG
jgi:hypothetical protein